MNDYALPIALVIICLSLVAVLLIYLHYRRLERNCNRYLVKYVREQERLKRELERILIEKEAIENMLKSKLSDTAENTGAGSMTVTVITKKSG